MSKIDTIKYLWKNNKRELGVAVFNHLVHIGIFNFMSDSAFVKLTYKVHVGKKLNLEMPAGFNEKLQWLKIYDHNPKYVDLVDKAQVKEIVGKIVGEEYIIPTIGIWDNYESINFAELPDQFVLKCTHDSGSVCVCKDKDQFNFANAKKKLSKAL